MKCSILLLAFLCMGTLQAEEYQMRKWQDSIVIGSDDSKRCISGISNEFGAFITLNVLNNKVAKELEFKSGIDLPNKGRIISDFLFFNNKDERSVELKLKLKQATIEDQQYFVLDESLNKKEDIEKMVTYMKKYHYFYMKVFDKTWNQTLYKFSLVGARDKINQLEEKCQ